jgi:hypothetical protein
MAKGVLLVGPYLVHVIGTRTGMAQARPARTTEDYGTVPAVPSRPKAERARASDPVGPLNGGVKTSSNSIKQRLYGVSNEESSNGHTQRVKSNAKQVPNLLPSRPSPSAAPKKLASPPPAPRPMTKRR